MRFVIIGAGEVGLCLCHYLLGGDEEVILIERNEALVKKLSERITARLICGDSTLFSTLRQIDLPQVDAVLAMTQDDASNILSCTLAKKLGAKKTICRIHHERYNDTQLFNYQAHFLIDHLIDTQHVCAFKIAKYIRSSHKVAIEQFSRGKIDVQSIRLAEKSPWIGKTVLQLALKKHIRIGLIQRGKQYMIPDKDTTLQSNDLLTLAIDKTQLSGDSIHPDNQQAVRITIFSASEVTFSLLQILYETQFKIKVIEPDLTLCNRLAERYPHISVIHGSATQLSLLQEEQIDASDYFIACSSNDENNIIACLQAQKAGAQHTLLWINKEDYDAVCDSLKQTLHIQQLILTKDCLINELENVLFPQTIRTLAVLGHEDNSPELIEVNVTSGSRVEGLTLDHIPWPEHTLLLVLKHQFYTKVPSAKDCLIGGDTVIAVVQKCKRQALIQLLTQKASL